MINKAFKRIHNKYIPLFKFIFFLRYLLAIFLISFFSYLLIPNFFDYTKKENIFKNFLQKNYNLKLKEFEKIHYKSFPRPRIEITKAKLSINSSEAYLESEKLNINLKFTNIYNLENMHPNKIYLNQSYLKMEYINFKKLFNYFATLKNKITFDNTLLEILRDDKILIIFDNINYKNFGHKKNNFSGNVFGKKFKIKISNNYEKANFELVDTGVKFDINFDKKKDNNVLSGNVKLKILNSNIRFKFESNEKFIKIKESFLRSSHLSFENDSLINFNPFYAFVNSFNIKEINLDIFDKLEFSKLNKFQDLIKKINSENNIKYVAKRFNRNFIKDLNLSVNLAYGRLNYIKDISLSGAQSNCNGDINLITEYPKLTFNCLLKINDSKNFLKNFSIKQKKSNENSYIIFNGKINIIKNKINFEEIKFRKSYKATKEDLKFFNLAAEKNFFHRNFFGIFYRDNIKNFINEIN